MTSARSRITQIAVARRAGVTQGVVSAVFSPGSSMATSAETRERVLAAAAELGYQPKRTGVRSTDSGRSILYVTESVHSVIVAEGALGSRVAGREYDAFYGVLTSSISVAAQENGMELTMHNYCGREQLMDRLNSTGICGVIWSKGLDDTSLFDWVSAKFPVVRIGERGKMRGDAFLLGDAVSVDQEKNLEISLEYLYAKGHRKIAYYGHDESNRMTMARKEAYERYLKGRELRCQDEFLALPDRQDVSSVEKASLILDLWQKMGEAAPTAIITATIFVFALLSEAYRRGISIPRDLSLVGIDDTPTCRLLHPPLTVMNQHFAELGAAAVDLLVRRIADSDAPMRHIKVTPELIVRGSVSDRSLLGEAFQSKSNLNSQSSTEMAAA